MAGFDWERFLRSRRFEYDHSSARQVDISCPYCGPNHANHKLTINLDGRGWQCRRLPSAPGHSGKSPIPLIRRLLGCSEEEAREIVGVREHVRTVPTRSDVATKLDRLRRRFPSGRPSRISLPSEFRPLEAGDPSSEPFVAYLEKRGYREREIEWLARTYALHWATRGRFAWRLVFPVLDRDGRLQTWTARGIGRAPVPKYRQPKDVEVVCPAPQTLLGLDQLWRTPSPRVLVVCEGPLDATRISVSGAGLGVCGTCLFGKVMSAAQCLLIRELAGRFSRVAVLLDPDAERDSRRIARQLAPLRVLQPSLPAGVADPGDATAAQATQLCLELLAGRTDFTSGAGRAKIDAS